MNPIPLLARAHPMLNPGDIVTMDGMFNRPPAKSAAWWAMLLFGPQFACRHIGWAFRRKASDEHYQIPMRRRGLLVKRQPQTFRITEHAESR